MSTQPTQAWHDILRKLNLQEYKGKRHNDATLPREYTTVSYKIARLQNESMKEVKLLKSI